MNKKTCLITGGAGFIGTNVAANHLKKGDKVIAFDNLYRVGTPENLKWLKKQKGKFIFVKGDIRNDKKLLETFKKYKPNLVYHFAAQSIPENIYVPVQSTPKVGTRTITFGELWKRELRKNSPEKAQKGEVIFLKGNQVKALSFLNGGQWAPIKAIYRHWYDGKIVKLNQKWGVIEATPNHSIYSANLELSNPKENPELLTVRNINLVRGRKNKADKKLLEILAAYITEGCATVTKKRDYHIEISQKDKEWLENIQKAVKKVFGVKGWVFLQNKTKSHWVFVCSNKNLFNYLIKNCGRHSYQKFFPDWIFDLNPEYQEFFWQKLLEGDGMKDGRYKTTSYKLANQISLLLSLLNKKFTVFESEPKNKKWKTAWEFKTDKDFHYGLNQRKKKEVNYKGWVYDLEINPTHNFVCGIGNIVCHNTTMVTSVTNPREDFEINAFGSFNVLEAMRKTRCKAPAIYSSTNKVMGELLYIPIVEREKRYDYRDIKGINESFPLDFHGPYGCCYSAETDILTDNGWKKFYELLPNDMVLTYNIERKVAEYQTPTRHFAYHYSGKMYVQKNRRLNTCVTPNHKMLVSWDCDHNGLERPHLVEAQKIKGKPMAYLLAAKVREGENHTKFILPKVRPKKNKWHFRERSIPMENWLPFLGWYLSEGNCYEDLNTGGCSVTLTTCYRTEEAVRTLRAIGPSPCVKKHHVTATSKQLYEYVKRFGKSHNKYIPQEIKNLSQKYLTILLKSLLDGDGNKHSKNGWKYTTVSKKLADDVQEIAIKCGMTARVFLDKEGFYRVYINTTRTAQCNLDQDRSEWVDYNGMVYSVEVPNSVVMVRQNGCAYFSGNSKGAGDQYWLDYARIYGLNTIVFRQSGIYGPHQFGIEEQGWLAWFCNALLFDKPVTIFGDGKQVRDVLYVDDLLRAFNLAFKNIKKTRGNAYNIGGGPQFTLSIWELFAILEKLAGKKYNYSFSSWRPGDQKVYISDVSKAKKDFGWSPTVSPKEGVKNLYNWISQNHHLIERAGVFKSR